MSEKRALVCGAGGFIGAHLVNRLKRAGYWVRGADKKRPEFSETGADEFLLLDLCKEENCRTALTLADGKPFDLVCQLAADMGGMGYIHDAECDIMHNSILINVFMTSLAAQMGVPRYFFSSSVCVYRDMKHGEPEIPEEGVYPAFPDNEYGWEKLYSERMAMAFGRKHGMEVRIARFQNTYGADTLWHGQRAKAPAALSRKVALAKEGGTVEIWGDGSAVRSYTYIDDIIDGIWMLINSDIRVPVNIGSPQYINVRELVEAIASVAGKKVAIKSIPGPVGVESRAFSLDKIRSLGWEAKYDIHQGLAKLYPWILSQLSQHPDVTQ
ncbi:MAG: NAD-dependent epimerase/dehydratase family protein [Kiritimatiellaeota bacterium]|nr:NAD-dependent epimerase/dehydratase family protein [Kiritimatiellota bacterium]